MTDSVSDTHLTDSELYKVLSSAVAETWDAIMAAGEVGEFVKRVTFTTTAGTLEYPLEDVGTTQGIIPDDDFYKVATVYVDETNGHLRPIPRISPGEEQAYRAPAAAVPMVLYYVPCAPVWTLGTETFDGINGWEEHTLCTAAIFVMNKKQDDATPFKQRKRELEVRIASMGNRSRGEPPRVVRKRKQAYQDRYAYWHNNVSCWDIRGGNLELFYRFGVTP